MFDRDLHDELADLEDSLEELKLDEDTNAEEIAEIEEKIYEIKAEMDIVYNDSEIMGNLEDIED